MTILLSVLLSVGAAFLVSRWSSRTRVVDVVNTKRLQLWDDDGHIRAELFCLAADETVLNLHDNAGHLTTRLGGSGLTVYGGGRWVSGIDVEPPISRPGTGALRTEVGIDNGTACLRLFDGVTSHEWPSQIPVMELLVPRNAQEAQLNMSFGLGKTLHIRPEGDDVVISFEVAELVRGGFRVDGNIEGLSAQSPSSGG
jgi:hypothetical protein